MWDQRWSLRIGLLLIALAPATGAAQSLGSEFDLELRLNLERTVDRTLARLQQARPAEKTELDSERAAAPRETRQDSAPSRFGVALNREIAAYLARYRQRDREQILRGLSLFAGYQPQIAGSFAKEGVPQELALLGLVESGFDPLAVSPKQARGIWQFVPETGRRYGLRIGRGVDERTDPAKSTRAAARYLADLYRTFGDWPLALAAYNAGESRVLAAMARSRQKDFWSLSRMRLLPAETRSYVPAVLATILLLRGQEPASASAPDMAPHRNPGRILFASLSLSEPLDYTD